MQGVIYIGGVCPPFADVAPSMEHRRLVVAADSGYDNALAHGVAVDVLIGDMDSIADLSAVPDTVRQVRFPRDKDATDTELAIDYCRDAGCQRLLMIGGSGGSVDHLFALLWLFEGRRRVERWILRGGIVDCVDGGGDTDGGGDIDGGENSNGAGADIGAGIGDSTGAGIGDSDSKDSEGAGTDTGDGVGGRWRANDCRAGQIISLLPVGDGPWLLRSIGLRWPLDGVRWRRDMIAIRNEATADRVSITVDRGRMLVIHSLPTADHE